MHKIAVFRSKMKIFGLKTPTLWRFLWRFLSFRGIGFAFIASGIGFALRFIGKALA
jgi:hypothetical protein